MVNCATLVPDVPNKKNFRNKQTTLSAIHSTTNTEMPPKMILIVRPPSPMKTRQRNKDQHPGIADAPKSRRSHAEMEAIRFEAAQKKKITEEEKQKALKHVAE